MEEWNVLVQKITHGLISACIDYECVRNDIVREHGRATFHELQQEAFERMFSFNAMKTVSINYEDLDNDLTALLIGDDNDFDNG